MATLAANTWLSAEYLQSKFDAGLNFDDYLATDPVKAEKWRTVHQRAQLTAAQCELIAAFTRRMPVLISSGIWCGDCVQQCPLLQRIADANPRMIELKLVDRDEHLDLSQRIVINAGLRVPTVIFMAEDFEFVHLLGDRTLSRYRAVAARQLGPHCPLPGAPIGDDELSVTMQDWVNEFERVHLLLRLSQRLREKHGD